MLHQRPLFPLNTVLFPGGPLHLRLFEPRYLDMVSECLKLGEPFGVVLILDGEETGAAAATHEMGTLAEITDWESGEGGLLEIRCRGAARFRICSRRVQADQLVRGDLELIPAPQRLPVPEPFVPLAELLEDLVRRAARDYPQAPGQYQDAEWVGHRLAELLPFSLEQRQRFLEELDPIRRLERLAKTINFYD